MKTLMLRLLPILAIVAMPVDSQAMGRPIDDPCDHGVYTVLDDPYRSTGFVLSSQQQMALCDISLKMGWYRFNSSTGITMAQNCPQPYECGTIVPIWMKGGLPSRDDGVVTRQACGRYNNDCCYFSLNIQVKRCLGFYVYYLHPAPSCPFSYCAGDKTPCPFGKWSPTMLPPCTDAFPMITTNPKLTGPIINGTTSFNFQCEVIFPDENPLQVFEVVWTFDGQEDPKIPTQQLSDPNRNATLEGYYLRGHLNKYVDCKVRSYYIGNEANKSPYLTSNSYYCGIEVSPNQLIASEEDFEHSINVTSTIPVICDFFSRCCLNLQLDINVSSDALIWNNCTYNLCGDTWNDDTKSATVEVQVMAKQDMVNEKEDNHLLLTFEPINQLIGGKYFQLFNGYRPDQVQVITKNSDTTTCSVVNDPNIYSFDHGYYRLYKFGDFTVAEVPGMDLQIQIRTWPCSRGSCICGVVIREVNEIIRVDQCTPGTAPKLERGRSLGAGTTVLRSSEGKSFGVYLPTGSEIKITSHGTFLKLYIRLAGVYAGKTRGLCGTNDGRRDNEFTYPDDRVDPYRGSLVLEEFAEAWRVSTTTNPPSLFEVTPPEKPVTNVTQYCTCGQTSGGQIVDCNFRPSNPTGWACNRCPEVPESKIPEMTPSLKREDIYEDFDEADEPYVQEPDRPVDPNKQWPNSQGITESQARQMCTNAVEKSQLSAKNSEMQELYDVSIMMCLFDILYGETTEFVDSITEAFTAQTQAALAKDPDNYVTNIEGKVVMKPEYLNDICDESCDEHGLCGPGGICQCDEGWEGTNCHIESGKGPQMARFRSGPLCDKTQRPCEKIYTDISNVDLTEQLACRVQAVDEFGNDEGLPIDTNATSLSALRITCDIPETAVSTQRYKISASNDGSLFGNEKTLRVFDSTCMDCDETSCTVKTTACHINKVCYRDGTKKSDDPYKVCDITKDTTDWTTLPPPTTAPSPQPTTTTTVMMTTSTPVKTEPTTTNPDILDASDICREMQLGTGIHPHPYDCTKFVDCVGTHTYIMECQEGLTYDHSIQSCNYPSLNKSC